MGYVYDVETGLYYLQSRYYNPQWDRFISADAFVSTGQGILGNNMFAYCNNNPITHVDSSGSIPREFSSFAFAMSSDGGGGNFGSVSGSGIPIEKPILNAISKTEQVLNAVYTNIDFSLGVGLGLYGEVDIGDVASLGFGISYNLVEVTFDDGRLNLQQSYNEGISASLLFVDVFQNLNESGSRELCFSSPYTDFIPDTYNSNWTIAGIGAYFFVGGSIYLGFDMISFCQDINALFF